MTAKILDWLFGVIARPAGTLNEIARERPVGWALLVYLFVTLLVMLASFYGDASSASIQEALSQFNIYIPLSVIIFGALFFSILALFVSAALLHLFARLFGGGGGFWNFFSAYAFTTFPMIFSVPVFLLAGFTGAAGGFLSGMVSMGLSIWVLVLDVIAVKESYGLSLGRSIGAYLVYLALIVIVPLVIAVFLVLALIAI